MSKIKLRSGRYIDSPKCPYCQSQAILVTGAHVYPHRPDLSGKKFWVCDPCDARVGCHGKGQTPLGRLADAELRTWKSRTHAAFDPLWKNGKLTRTTAYAKLAERLGIEKTDCHIGMFDVATCKKAVEILPEIK